jgi:hypothetical protein
MKYIFTYASYKISLPKKENNHYQETSWTDNIDGKEVKITIQEVQDYLKNSPIIDIPVSEISNLCIHKDKDDEETLLRSQKSDLSFPIIISKNEDGKYGMILDGHHRLLKAINNGEETIKAKVLDLSTAPREYKEMFK